MAKAATYQCPNCGGVASFDAQTGKVVCEFCGSVLELGEVGRTIPVGDGSVEAQQTDHVRSVEDFLERAPWQVMEDGTANAMTYSCPSCAAQVVADQSTVATSCPYCGNNLLVSGIANASNVPQLVLPFELTQEQAERNMRAHFEHKWYLSRKFDAQLAHMQAVYVPYHLYKMRVWGNASYVGSHKVDSGDDEVTYYYAAKRAGHAVFNRIPVDGSSKMPDGHMDAIAPFHFDKMLPFSADYAAGYLMEVADEDAQTCQSRAEIRARNSFESDLAADVRRDPKIDSIEKVVRQQTDVSVENIESCVLPVWLMHCTWEGVQMLFAVNGETGRCVGDLPVDGKRRGMTIGALALATLVLTALAFIVASSGDAEDSIKLPAGILIFGIIATIVVDGMCMGQMHTATEATDAHMSYDAEGLVVTESWRSNKSYGSARKAQRLLE